MQKARRSGIFEFHCFSCDAWIGWIAAEFGFDCLICTHLGVSRGSIEETRKSSKVI